jgi:hypothetical protein
LSHVENRIGVRPPPTWLVADRCLIVGQRWAPAGCRAAPATRVVVPDNPGGICADRRQAGRIPPLAAPDALPAAVRIGYGRMCRVTQRARGTSRDVRLDLQKRRYQVRE